MRFEEMRFADGKERTSSGEPYCALWVQAVAVPPDVQLRGIGMPFNPCMHLFAMTLRRAETGA